MHSVYIIVFILFVANKYKIVKKCKQKIAIENYTGTHRRLRKASNRRSKALGSNLLSPVKASVTL